MSGQQKRRRSTAVKETPAEETPEAPQPESRPEPQRSNSQRRPWVYRDGRWVMAN